ncbi:MAG: glycerol-3-phosphate acyltransferase [Legionellales bacterium]|nr:glycerol-3-phosphate acyltransferase [Legionellales bacterium]
MLIHTLIGIVCAYGIGCCSTAYYAVKFLQGKDLRQLGTGTLGARNASRVLGKNWALVIFWLDMLRGMLAIAVAYGLGLTDWGMGSCVVAVIAGHIWPLHLRFQGGKGIGVSLGALLVWNFPVMLCFGLLGVLIYLITLRFKLTGLITLLFLPIFSVLLLQTPAHYIMLLAIVGMLVLAHWENIQKNPCATSH